MLSRGGYWFPGWFHESAYAGSIPAPATKGAKRMVTKTVELSRARKNWRPDELAYLSRHFGLLPDEEICQFLGRSRNALKLAAYRKLNGQKRKDNFYSSCEVARSLGIRDAHTIVLWVHKGWLPYKKGPMFQGPYQVWSFSEQDIIKCLKRRPWLVRRDRVRQYCFRAVVNEEWARNPWYTPEQACSLLGVESTNTIHGYIYKGWLEAEKKPGGPWQGVWIIRQSAIEIFLQNDPRAEHKRQTLRLARRKGRLSKGNPVRISTSWEIKCPSCHNRVEIVAPAMLRGPQVKELFLAVYVNGRCSHGSVCYLGRQKPAPMPKACPKCGGRLFDDEEGKHCFTCGKIVYR